MLISRGLTPSVFFRPPGLVSSPTLGKLINELGLIAVGTDAWLAKGEKINPGNIVLVYGNSSEPKGIDIFMKWSKDNQLAFLPLSQSIRNISNSS